MPQNLMLSVICDDKPGIVKTIAETVADNGGNWLESRLAQLDGKFAGVIRISTAEEQLATLEDALGALRTQGLLIQIEPVYDKVVRSPSSLATFSLAGPDRPGIVRDLAKAFLQYDMNVEELVTHRTSMPYSGEPLFEAEGVILVPEGVALEPLMAQIDEIAEALALDIRIEQIDNPSAPEPF